MRARLAVLGCVFVGCHGNVDAGKPHDASFSAQDDAGRGRVEESARDNATTGSVDTVNPTRADATLDEIASGVDVAPDVVDDTVTDVVAPADTHDSSTPDSEDRTSGVTSSGESTSESDEASGGSTSSATSDDATISVDADDAASNQTDEPTSNDATNDEVSESDANSNGDETNDETNPDVTNDTNDTGHTTTDVPSSEPEDDESNTSGVTSDPSGSPDAGSTDDESDGPDPSLVAPPIRASALGDMLEESNLLPLASTLDDADEIAHVSLMHSFEDSLGDCASCHVEDYAVWTPQKYVAVHMWEDVMTKLRFKDGGLLYCDSCHQGQAQFLNRSDLAAVGLWMQINFVDQLERVDGLPHGCETCHGEPLNYDLISDWSADSE